MRCPRCGGDDWRIRNTRQLRDRTKRYRVCQNCKYVQTTFEGEQQVLERRRAQIVALRELLRAYQACERFYYPKTHRLPPECGDVSARLREADAALTQRVCDARSEVVSSGFPYPDEWLTVNAVGELVSERDPNSDRPIPECDFLVTYTGADRRELRATCRTIGLAIAKLKRAPVDFDPGAKSEPDRFREALRSKPKLAELYELVSARSPRREAVVDMLGYPDRQRLRNNLFELNKVLESVEPGTSIMGDPLRIESAR